MSLKCWLTCYSNTWRSY